MTLGYSTRTLGHHHDAVLWLGKWGLSPVRRSGFINDELMACKVRCIGV